MISYQNEDIKSPQLKSFVQTYNNKCISLLIYCYESVKIKISIEYDDTLFSKEFYYSELKENKYFRNYNEMEYFHTLIKKIEDKSISLNIIDDKFELKISYLFERETTFYEILEIPKLEKEPFDNPLLKDMICKISNLESQIITNEIRYKTIEENFLALKEEHDFLMNDPKNTYKSQKAEKNFSKCLTKYEYADQKFEFKVKCMLKLSYNKIACGLFDSRVLVFDLNNPLNNKELKEHTDIVVSLALLPNNILASLSNVISKDLIGYLNSTIIIWNLSDPRIKRFKICLLDTLLIYSLNTKSLILYGVNKELKIATINFENKTYDINEANIVEEVDCCLNIDNGKVICSSKDFIIILNENFSEEIGKNKINLDFPYTNLIQIDETLISFSTKTGNIVIYDWVKCIISCTLVSKEDKVCLLKFDYGKILSVDSQNYLEIWDIKKEISLGRSRDISQKNINALIMANAGIVASGSIKGVFFYKIDFLSL